VDNRQPRREKGVRKNWRKRRTSSVQKGEGTEKRQKRKFLGSIASVGGF
jgi:hypothetical protein